MKRLFLSLVLLISSFSAFAQDQVFDIGNGEVVTDQGASCYFISQVEFNFKGQEILDFCSRGSDITPVLCYRFLSKARDLELFKAGAFEICKGAISSTQKIDCVMDYKMASQDRYKPEEAVQLCRD